MMKKAIVIGASSGIGAALVKVLAAENYSIGMAARRIELLNELQREISSKTYIQRIDVSKTEEAMGLLTELIKEMGGVDLVIVSSGVAYTNPELDWHKEKETMEANVLGFIAMANVAVKHFLNQGSGILVGISSVGAVRGSADAPAYRASKACISNYMEGLRFKAKKSGKDIQIIDVRPGYVDTAMTKEEKGIFWVSSPEAVARGIYKAIKKKKAYAYIPGRWHVVAWLFRFAPVWLLK